MKLPPFILKGGYHEWLMHYPTLTTNAKVEPPPLASPARTNIYKDAKKVDPSAYDLSRLNEKPDPPKPTPAPPTNATVPVKREESRVSVEAGAGTVHNMNGEEKLAKPRAATNPPQFNRELKPNFAPGKSQPQVNAKTNDVLPKPTQSQPPIPGKAVQVNTETDTSSKPMSTSMPKPTPKPTSASPPAPASAPASAPGKHQLNPEPHDASPKPLPAPAPAPAPLTNGDHVISRPTRQADRTLSESKSGNIAALSSNATGLTRSYSSPNIAQALADEDDEDGENKLVKSRSSTNPPLFNRSLKPNYSPGKSLIQLNAKSRDFSPVYGLAGQAVTGLKNLGTFARRRRSISTN